MLTHWYHDMAPIHPIVSYLNCPACKEIKKEEFVFISQDLKHDFHAVNRFMSTVIKKLQERNYSIDKVVQFSDGAASQYKCKTPGPVEVQRRTAHGPVNIPSLPRSPTTTLQWEALTDSTSWLHTTLSDANQASGGGIFFTFSSKPPSSTVELFSHNPTVPSQKLIS